MPPLGDGFYHEMIIDAILSDPANYIIAGLAILLSLMYLGEYKCQPKFYHLPRRVRRIGILTRAVNWGILGGVFLIFGIVVESMGLTTWRATARLAVLFLLMSEIAFEFGVLWGFRRELLSWKRPNTSST